MAHFAKIENGLVTEIIIISNEICGEPTLEFPDTCAAGRACIANTLKLEGVWKQTSYNANFRGVYAGVGYTWTGKTFKAPVIPEPEPVEEVTP